MTDWNPNWVAFAVSQGTTPERLSKTGAAASFIIWMIAAASSNTSSSLAQSVTWNIKASSRVSMPAGRRC